MPEIDDKEQRTEEATEKRRRETREKGRFAQSRELTSVFVLMGSILTFYFFGIFIARHITLFMQGFFSGSAVIRLTDSNAYPFLFYIIKETAVIIAPLFVIILISGIIANILQAGGFVFSLDPITPKLSRINPMDGFGRIFSKQAFAELLKSLFKLGIVSYIAYSTVRGEFSNLPSLLDVENGQTFLYISKISFKIIFRTFLVLIILAAIDYGFQKWSFEQSIKMTKQEIRDERKETEGDPRIKARIRGIQLQMARKRMMAAVPKADVIITNPIHLAVAVKYDRGKMLAPEVVAKGAGFIAEKIKETAKKAGIPVVEDKPVARMLYKMVDIGEAIPATLYKAIAEILAYVYKLKGKKQ
jgi:flagellar biosynthetic protein FlhB